MQSILRRQHSNWARRWPKLLRQLRRILLAANPQKSIPSTDTLRAAAQNWAYPHPSTARCTRSSNSLRAQRIFSRLDQLVMCFLSAFNPASTRGVARWPRDAGLLNGFGTLIPDELRTATRGEQRQQSDLC